MDVTNMGQVYQALLSAGFGFVLGVYYELFRFLRKLFGSRAASVIGQDLLFFTTASCATYLFDLYLTGGMLRWYLFVGIAIGFSVYYATVGRLLFAASSWVAGVWHRLQTAVGAAVFRCRTALAKKLDPCKRQIIKKYHQLRGFFSKKVLKRQEEVLYNREE